nr:hypothetical protein [uncultured Rhodopila sp.]
MSIKGQVNLINNPQVFFGELLLGNGTTPTGGFVPSKSSGLVAELVGLLPGPAPVGAPALPPVPIPVTANVSAADGSFTLPDFPAEFAKIQTVTLRLLLNGRPFYRTGWFPRAHLNKTLATFVYQPSLPKTDGIKAGDVSKGLAGAGLPADTTLVAGPSGLFVGASQSGVDLGFGVALIPDTSSDLSLFFDLALNGYNIHVGMPAACGTNADAILAQIKSELQTSGSKVNGVVADALNRACESPPLSLSPDATKKLLGLVSIQFVSVTYPIPVPGYLWPLSAQSDQTIVAAPQLTLGFPRVF